MHKGVERSAERVQEAGAALRRRTASGVGHTRDAVRDGGARVRSGAESTWQHSRPWMRVAGRLALTAVVVGGAVDVMNEAVQAVRRTDRAA